MLFARFTLPRRIALINRVRVDAGVFRELAANRINVSESAHIERECEIRICNAKAEPLVIVFTSEARHLLRQRSQLVLIVASMLFAP